VIAPERLRLCLVTPEGLREAELLNLAASALEGGVTLIQLRDKRRDDRELYGLAVALRGLCAARGAPLFLDDRLDLALAARADGVHLGQRDLPAREARRLAPPSFLLGVSVGDPGEARRAAEEGADYLGVGAVYPTASKGDALLAGLDGLRRVTAASALPVVAIGGVDRPDRAEAVLLAGASGVAAISGIARAGDVREAARAMRERIDRILARRGKELPSRPTGEGPEEALGREEEGGARPCRTAR
jgi:thiamine-phosphate pyrophosphorylase